MTELHSFIVLYNGKFIRAYNESDADKAIAELKQKFRDAVLWATKADAVNDILTEQLRHAKYKRCLAMAKWCMARYNEWSAFYPTTTTKEMKFLDKWEKRWRKLAEYFKEAQ